jgi:hypothetical protein
VVSFKNYREKHNLENVAVISSDTAVALPRLSAEFIETASGLKSRYAMNKSVMFVPVIMCPQIAEWSEQLFMDRVATTKADLEELSKLEDDDSAPKK